MKPLTTIAPSYHAGPNMTPLVDVVMVILIFLMLAGSFGSSEHFMASNVPLHGLIGMPPTMRVLTLPIRLDVQISQNGDARVPGLAREPDPAVIEQELAAKMADYQQHGHSPRDIEVVLHPVAGTKWESIAPLYEAALNAKFENVSFAQFGD